MTLKANTFEGQPDGTTWTAANSGGDSGDAFDTFTASGTYTRLFSTTTAAHGTTSLYINGTAASTAIVRWTTFNGSPLSLRAYVYLVSNAATAQDIFSVRNSGAAACSVGLSTAGGLVIKNSSGTSLKTFIAMTTN